MSESYALIMKCGRTTGQTDTNYRDFKFSIDGASNHTHPLAARWKGARACRRAFDTDIVGPNMVFAVVGRLPHELSTCAKNGVLSYGKLVCMENPAHTPDRCRPGRDDPQPAFSSAGSGRLSDYCTRSLIQNVTKCHNNRGNFRVSKFP